ncbi:Complexin-1 [Armadillidium vulgare]|nr:Complexin-1 [Armadillidium vulgare]
MLQLKLNLDVFTRNLIFIAKYFFITKVFYSFKCQMFSQIDRAVGGGESDEGDKEKEEEAERERLEAMREAEDRRKEKHRKLEEERESMRQGIRDKILIIFINTFYNTK